MSQVDYEQVVARFAEQAPVFAECLIWEPTPGKPEGYGSSGWEREMLGRVCDCCGSQRVKFFKAIKANGQVWWIGSNCFALLQKLGKIRGKAEIEIKEEEK